MVVRTEAEHKDRAARLAVYIQQLIDSGATKGQAELIIADQYEFDSITSLKAYLKSYK